MRFVCTDRGQHAERALVSSYRDQRGHLEWAPSANKHMQKGSKPGPAGEGPSWLVDGERMPGWNDSAWKFKCPSCSRTPEINKNKLDDLVAELERVGATKFDTSYLE